MRNALTVDVEEYFHAAELRVDRSDWDNLPSRAGVQVERTLEVLASAGVRATFFVVGWLARRQPGLVREIATAGHEIGCHSHLHRLVYTLSPEAFRTDTLLAKAAIEDACGVSPTAYRAPNYSITRRSTWALDVLAECGFTHDSSIYPIAHDRYGFPGFPRSVVEIATRAGGIVEAPVATVGLPGGMAAPAGGGAYLRLLPYRYLAAGLRRLNTVERVPGCIYFHPWELDREMPRVRAGAIARLRTYAGLGGMQRKIERLLDEFSFAPISAVFPLLGGRAPAPMRLAEAAAS